MTPVVVLGNLRPAPVPELQSRVPPGDWRIAERNGQRLLNLPDDDGERGQGSRGARDPDSEWQGL
jgi:hypothetical protein